MRTGHFALPLLLSLLPSPWPGAAAAAETPNIPDALKPWTGWVLKGQEDKACPGTGEGETRRCLWPGGVELTVDGNGGSFTLSAKAFARAVADLPGSDARWPLDVELDGKPALVRLNGKKPAVELEAGAHVLTGHFQWSRLPEALDLPSDVGLVELTVAGARVPFPVVDAAGRTFLKSTSAAEANASDSLDLQVFRKVDDDIPLLLTTRVELKVAGRNREVSLGPVLSADYTAVSVASDLPAALEADGKLRVQVRPGDYSVTVVARHNGPAEVLKRPAAAEPWVESEIWAFAAQNQLRLVTVEGAGAVDPQQTSLPAEWKKLPAFLMAKDTALGLTTRKRGDPDPAPDRLALARQIWLDFDGGGYTMRDAVTGTISRSWRLSVQSPAVLGRASTDGKDQLITRRADGEGSGIEVRRGELKMEADLRLPEATASLPATAWRADFQSVGASLHLPPGYKLLAAMGVDYASGTWLKSWDLLNIFVVLLVALALAKLLGRMQGAIALLALTLVIPEDGAPKYIWLTLVPLLALLKYLPAGRIKHLIALVHGALGVGLVLMSLVFAIHQVRTAIFPSLEYEWKNLEIGASDSLSSVAEPTTVDEAKMPMEDAAAEAPSPQQQMAEADGVPEGAGGAAKSEGSRSDLAKVSPKKMAAPSQVYQNRQLAEVDPNATVQTGAGVPNWTWNKFQLGWSGPVRQDQTFRLVLLPPVANALVSILRVLLLFYMIVAVFGFKWRDFSGWVSRLGAAALLVFLVAPPPPARAADFPPDAMLTELRNRLLPKTPCGTSCATIGRLRIEADADSLSVLLEAHAAADTQIPLPGNAAQWLPAQVLVDGKPSKDLRREADGVLWLALSAGVHKVELKGRIPAHETLQLPLPLKPHYVSYSGSAWAADGIHDDGAADDTVVLVRQRPKGGTAPEATKDSALPPFIRVQRTVELGLAWTVTTRVERLSAGSVAGGAVVLRVPVLAGEKVLTAGARVDKGTVLVNMGPKEDGFEWTSSLDIAPQLALKAPETLAWTEVWRVSLSPVWHLETTGLPVIHHVDGSGERLPEWRPWPGETVELAVTRPESISGQSLTMDRAFLDVRPGIRSSDLTLTLSLRASRGGEHKLKLPDGVELQSVSINGQTQPIRLEGGGLTLPLLPGAQKIAAVWRDANGMSLLYRTAALDAGLPGVNATVHVTPPAERWVLFLGGQGVGPAVLFWSQILVLILAAFALGRFPLTPIRSWQWFLLGIGLLQSSLIGVAVVVGFFLALGARRTQLPRVKTVGLYNLGQVALIGWACLAAGIVFYALEEGFFGRPDMQIAGNGSSAASLLWFKDRTQGALPTAWILSVPMFVYQIAMLLWALWFAFAAVRWSRWAYESFAAGSLWRQWPKREPVKAPEPPKAPES